MPSAAPSTPTARCTPSDLCRSWLAGRWPLALLLGLLYGVGAFHAEYSDEFDNILGGQRLADGYPLYRGYFSHHFPLPYLISGFLHLFFVNENLVLFRLMWGSSLVLWSLWLDYYIGAGPARSAVRTTLVLLALLAPAAWLHMLVAENIIAYGLLTFIVIATTREGELNRQDLTVCASVVGMIFLCSLGYIFLCTWIALCIVLTARSRPREIARVSAVAAALPVVVLVYLLISSDLREAFLQTVTFNKEYYFHFAGNMPSSALGSLWFSIKNALLEIIAVSTHPFGSSAFAFYALCILGFALMNLTLLRRKRYRCALMILPTLILAMTRFSSDFTFANSRNVIIYPLGLYALAWCTFVGCKSALAPEWARITTGILLGLATILTIRFATDAHMRTLHGEYISNYSATACAVNSIASPSDFYWVGPFDFKAQYLIRAKPASRYGFYLPWLAASPKITSELLSEFKQNRPRVIAFDARLVIWNNPAREYARELLAWIKQSYRPLSEKGYERIFILNSTQR